MYSKNYNFCKFRIPEHSGRVIWEITNVCNYSCSYCIFASTGKKPVGELTTQEIFNTIDELKKHNFKYLKFTGGEPFLREDMVDILKYSFKNDMICDISTNASFITNEIAKNLSLLPLEMIHVSIDGHNQEIHEKVRGKNSFIPTIKGLELLTQYNKNIRVGCVIHKHNEQYIKEMVKLGEKYDIKEIIFSMMEPVGRLRHKDDNLATKKITDLQNEIINIQSSIKVSHNLNSNSSIEKSDKLCPGGKKFLFINSLGVVSPCTWVTEKKPQFQLGNLKNNSLSQLLNNDVMKNFNLSHSSIKGVCPIESKIDVNVKFSNQSQIYSFTTENLEYLTHLNIKNKKVLTVGASLDQAIMCFLQGAIEVVNFDINKYAKYYSELKFIAIKKLNYIDFIQFFSKGPQSFSKAIFNRLKHDLSEEAFNFFNEQYHIFKTGVDFRNSYIFNNLFDNPEEKIHNSFYCRDRALYASAQEKIKNKPFNWIESSIEKFDINDLFDIILLSNIADYSHKMFLSSSHAEIYRDNIVKKFLQFLKPQGAIMFAYIFDYGNNNNSHVRNKINDQTYRKKIYTLPNYDYNEIVINSAIKNLSTDCACLLTRK